MFTWTIIHIQVTFESLLIDRSTSQLTHSESVATAKLFVDREAKAMIATEGNAPVECTFWWEQLSNAVYPHLWIKILRNGVELYQNGLDFVRTIPE